MGLLFSGKLVGGIKTRTVKLSAWLRSLTQIEYTGDAITGELFGYGSAISGNGLVTAIGGKQNLALTQAYGSVTIYDVSGATSNIIGEFDNPQLEASSDFGKSVALNSDGTVCVVGASRLDIHGSNAGGAFVYEYNGSSWSSPVELVSPTYHNYDGFGRLVEISADGTLIAVKSSREAIGEYTIELYSKSGGTWSYVTTLDPVENDSEFSFDPLTMSKDGSTIAIGDFEYSVSSLSKVGKVYVYHNNGTSWEQQTVTLPALMSGIRFGYDLALNSDGSKLFVSQPYANSQKGEIHEMTFSGGSWNSINKFSANTETTSLRLGSCVSCDDAGTTVFAGNVNGDTSVIIFKKSGSTWEQIRKIDNPLPGNYRVITKCLSSYDGLTLSTTWIAAVSLSGSAFVYRVTD